MNHSKIVISSKSFDGEKYKVLTKRGGLLVGYYFPAGHRIIGILEMAGRDVKGNSRANVKKKFSEKYDMLRGEVFREMQR